MHYFDNATYLHASAPRTLPGGDHTMSFDDMGVYGVDGVVVAVMRHQQPPPSEAPRYEAVQQAVVSTYGSPTVSRRSGAGIVYEWHFDARGGLIAEGDGRTCESRIRGDKKDSRVIFLQRKELETSFMEIAQGRPPRIEDKTDLSELRVTTQCSYSIRYHIDPTSEGLLDFLSASMYAYDPVRTEIWGGRSERLGEEIAADLQRQKSSASVEPDL